MPVAPPAVDKHRCPQTLPNVRGGEKLASGFTWIVLMGFWEIPLYFTYFCLESFRRSRCVFKLGMCFYFNCKCFNLVCKVPWANTECWQNMYTWNTWNSHSVVNQLCVLSHSVVSDCLQPRGCQASLSVVFPRQEHQTGHFLLQGIVPTQRSNRHLLCILPWQVGILSTQRKFSLQILVFLVFESTEIHLHIKETQVTIIRHSTNSLIKFY